MPPLRMMEVSELPQHLVVGAELPPSEETCSSISQAGFLLSVPSVVIFGQSIPKDKWRVPVNPDSLS